MSDDLVKRLRAMGKKKLVGFEPELLDEIDRLRAELEETRRMYEQAHKDRLREAQRARELEDDKEQLTLLASHLGAVVRGDADSDFANDAWRSLPDYLQDEIEVLANSEKE